MRRILRVWGYDPRVAAGGQEALELCEVQMPVVVLIDVMMPGMDGWQLSKKLIRLPEPPVMILISGSFKTEDVHPDAAVLATLPKPVNTELLHELIERAISRSEGPPAPNEGGSPASP